MLAMWKNMSILENISCYVPGRFSPGQICCRGQGSQSLVVLNVNGSAALDGHVEHVDVVVHHHDVGDSATIGVLIQLDGQPKSDKKKPADQNCPPWPKLVDRSPLGSEPRQSSSDTHPRRRILHAEANEINYLLFCE